MKNIFKSLMFVAVAAMTFTACTEENNEVNAVSKQSVLKFETTFDETRVTIGDKDGDYYPLTWDGDENVLFDIQDNGWWSDLNSTITVDEDNAANASFEVILDGYAAGALVDEGSTIYARLGKFSGFAPNLNAYIADQTQTPTATSVDKSFITMLAEFPVEVEGQMVFNGRFEHKAAYGVVTLPAAVDAVEFKTIRINVNDAKTYTLNVEGLDTHSYWFACEPEAVNSLDVTGVASDDTIYQYTAEGLEKEFKAGVISKFSLKKFEAASSINMTAYWYGGNEFVLQVLDVATSTQLLSIDGYTVDSTILAAGTYNVVADWTNNDAYQIVGSWCTPNLSSGTMVVEHLDKGYKVTINVTDKDSNTHNYTYSGNISGTYGGDFYNPGDPVKIDMPSNLTATADVNSIVFDWDDVANATGYDVKVTYSENWEQKVAYEGHVEESTCTATGLNALTNYTIQVVATTTVEGYRNSDAAYYSVSTLADQSALDAEFTDAATFNVMTKLANYENTYLFTTTGGGTTKSDKFMYLSFNKAIDFTVDGEYGFDDINFMSGQTVFWLGDTMSSYSGWSSAQSYYSLAFTPYHFYNNGSDVCLIYVDANDNGTVTVTVYGTNPSWWSSIKYKGSFTGTITVQ